MYINRLKIYLSINRFSAIIVFKFCMKKTPPEIRILPDDVANRIAAGEVVERPAAVAKELLENAIDAGATRIEIEFKRGGKSFIKVSDDGCGMTRQQALTSLEPHATSKIRSPEDLFRISSYGFRGEAVPSIASVSKFKIRTRPEAQTFGTEIDVYAGSVNSVRDCGMASGTEIIVENLFCSVPARRKFLKSDNVEASHIIKLCRLYALALPHLSITLIENSRVVFRSERNVGTIERIERIFGGEVAGKLIDLPKVQSKHATVSGAILKTGESFATSRNICAFVNGRPVECKVVYSAIKEAYSQYIPKGRFASAFLFIELDPETVDVNVHPQKREVRLKNEFEIRDFLFETISAELKKQSSIRPILSVDSSTQSTIEIDEPTSQKETPKISILPKPAFTPQTTQILPKPTISPLAEKIAEKKVSLNVENNPTPPPAQKTIQQPIHTPTAILSNKSAIVANWKYIGCFKKRYAIFETAKGLVLMSISSAIKRVRFEEILRSLRGSNVEAQTLLVPISLKFERGDDEYFSANRKAFETCGFQIEDFGKAFYRILAIPSWLKYSSAENFIRDFVEIAREENKSLKKSKMSDESFAKALVERVGSANFDCTETSAMELLATLLSGDNHNTSPTGSPTLKEISDSELSRFF